MRPTIRVVAAFLASAAALVLVGGCGGDSNLPPEASKGRDIAISAGCASCHGRDGQGGIGPKWQGVVGSEVKLDDGSVVVADPDYLRRSIKDPSVELVAGFTLKMPENQLSDADVGAVLAYIDHLSSAGKVE